MKFTDYVPKYVTISKTTRMLKNDNFCEINPLFLYLLESGIAKMMRTHIFLAMSLYQLYSAIRVGL